MSQAVFLPKADLYRKDYDCLFRNQDLEPYVSLSYHDFYEFQIFLGEAGVMRIGGEEHNVGRGDLAFVNMFTPHALSISPGSQYERFSMSIDASFLISMSTSCTNLLDVFRCDRSHPPVIHLEPESFARYTALLDLYRNTRLAFGSDVLDKSVIHQLLAYAYNDCYAHREPDEKSTRYVTIISRLIAYINSHLCDELSLDVLAEQVNYSEYYVCRIFKKMTGKNLSSYIQEKRIGVAAQLLRSNVPIQQAAEQVGFNNYSYFYKTFLKLNGCSPNAYRKRYSSSAGGTAAQ